MQLGLFALCPGSWHKLAQAAGETATAICHHSVEAALPCIGQQPIQLGRQARSGGRMKAFLVYDGLEKSRGVAQW